MAGRERRSSNREDGPVGDEWSPKQCAVAGLSADEDDVEVIGVFYNIKMKSRLP